MAKDYGLNSQHDLGKQDGDFYFKEDREEIPQKVNITVLKVQGEDRYNLASGIPWDSEEGGAFSPQTPRSVVEAYVRGAIISIAEVDAITQFELSVDPEENGGYLIRWYGDSIFGPVGTEI